MTDGYFWVPNFYFAVLVQILAALAYLHQSGVNIIHRKVEPRNILYDKSGQFVLTDFGDARRAQPPSRDPDLARELFPYRPPEMFDGRPQTPKVDVWMLGIVCMAILDLPWTDEPPVNLEGMRKSLWQQQMAQLAAAYTGRPELSVMVRMDPEERDSALGLFDRLSRNPSGTAFRFRPTRELVEMKIQGTMGAMPDIELAHHVAQLEDRYGEFERAKAPIELLLPEPTLDEPSPSELDDQLPSSRILLPVRLPRLGVSQATVLPGYQVPARRPLRKLGITSLPTSRMMRQAQEEWQSMTIDERRAATGETPLDPILVDVLQSHDRPSGARASRRESQAVLPPTSPKANRMQATRAIGTINKGGKSQSGASKADTGTTLSASSASQSRVSEHADAKESGGSVTSTARSANKEVAKSSNSTSRASSSNDSTKTTSSTFTPNVTVSCPDAKSMAPASAELGSNIFSLLAYEAMSGYISSDDNPRRTKKVKDSSPTKIDPPRSVSPGRKRELNADQVHTEELVRLPPLLKPPVGRSSLSLPADTLETPFSRQLDPSPCESPKQPRAAGNQAPDKSTLSSSGTDINSQPLPDQRPKNRSQQSQDQDGGSAASLRAIEKKILAALAHETTLATEVENARRSVDKLSLEFNQVLESIKGMSGPIISCLAASSQLGVESTASLRFSISRQTESIRNLNFHSIQSVGARQALERCKKLTLKSSQSREAGKAKASDILKSLEAVDGIVRTQAEAIKKAEELIQVMDRTRVLQNNKSAEYGSVCAQITQLRSKKRHIERGVRSRTDGSVGHRTSVLSVNAPAWDPVTNRWGGSVSPPALIEEARQASNQGQPDQSVHAVSEKNSTSSRISGDKSEANDGWQRVVQRQSSKGQRSGSQSQPDDSRHGSRTSSRSTAVTTASLTGASRGLVQGEKQSAPPRNQPRRTMLRGEQEPPINSSQTRRGTRGRGRGDKKDLAGTK